MPEDRDPAAKDHPVLQHFRQNRRTGSVNYDPKGDKGWAGASDVYVGVPGSKDVQDLLDAGLIGEPKDDSPPEPEDAPAVQPPLGNKKPAPAPASKES
jgi:hypothetical protein